MKNMDKKWIAELERLRVENKELLAALKKVMSWIDNWSPSFTEEEEWDDDVKIIRAVIARCAK